MPTPTPPPEFTALVVDDDQTLRAVLRQVLTHVGCAVHEAENGEQALEVFQRLHPDIVLLDVMMPVLNGIEACRQLRQLPGGSTVPILMSTALDDAASVKKAFEAGATDYITKPLHLAVVRQRVQRMLVSKRAEEAIARAKREWEATFDSVADMIFVTDGAGVVMRCNRAAAQRMQLPFAAIIGLTLAELLNGDTTLELPAAEGTETQFKRLPGWFRLTTHHITGGERIHAVHVLRDITEERQAQTKLRASEERYRSHVEQLPAITYTVEIFNPHQRGRTTYISPQVESILGYTPTEWLADEALWFRLIHPEDVGRVLEAVHRQNREGASLAIEYRSYTRDGRVVWLHNQNMLVWRDNGQRKYVEGVIFDISARKSAEARLQESEARFRSLFEAAPVMYLRVSHTERVPVIEAANQLFLDTLGYPREAVIGQPLANFYAEASRASLLAHEATTSGREWSAERQLVKHSGETIETILHAVPERDEAGIIVGIRAAYVDVTERKTLEAQMLAASKLAGIGTLAAGVAHEINSPLQVITGLSQSWLQKLEARAAALDQDRLRRNLETIHRSGWRCAEIVRSLRAYAHAGENQFELNELNSVVRDGMLLIEHQLSRWANIEITSDYGDGLPAIYCDRNQVTQVLINLLTNASDAMPGGGRIALRTRYWPEAARVSLEVSDSGTGIPEAVKAKIFDPFFTTKPIGKGTGLGLSIVSGILRAHGGEIEVESTLGQGTTFKLYFPEPSAQSLRANCDSLLPALGRFDDSLGSFPHHPAPVFVALNGG
jgi:PAS domain S-box-containing protein